jgi:hypothetical protein
MIRSQRRAGRVSLVAVAGIACLLMVAALFLLSGQSPGGAAGQFLTALAKGDVDKLADNSVLGGKDHDQLKAAWQETLKYARDYTFRWDITNVRQDSDGAVVRIDFTRNPYSSMSYPEHYELQMVQVGGKWKVDVSQIPRDMFPFVPQ